LPAAWARRGQSPADAASRRLQCVTLCVPLPHVHSDALRRPTDVAASAPPNVTPQFDEAILSRSGVTGARICHCPRREPCNASKRRRSLVVATDHLWHCHTGLADHRTAAHTGRPAARAGRALRAVPPAIAVRFGDSQSVAARFAPLSRILSALDHSNGSLGTSGNESRGRGPRRDADLAFSLGRSLSRAHLGRARAADLAARKIAARFHSVGSFARRLARRLTRGILERDRRPRGAVLLEISSRRGALPHFPVAGTDTRLRRVHADVAPRARGLLRLAWFGSFACVPRSLGLRSHSTFIARK